MLGMDQTASQSSPASSNVLFLLISSSDALSVMYDAACCSVCLFKHQKAAQCTFLPEEKRAAFTSLSRRQLQTGADTPYVRLRPFRSRMLLSQEPPLLWQLVSKDNSIHDCSRNVVVTTASSSKLKKLKAEALRGPFRVSPSETSLSTKKSEELEATPEIQHLLYKMI